MTVTQALCPEIVSKIGKIMFDALTSLWDGVRLIGGDYNGASEFAEALQDQRTDTYLKQIQAYKRQLEPDFLNYGWLRDEGMPKPPDTHAEWSKCTTTPFQNS